MDREMKQKLTALKVRSVAFSALECGARGMRALLRLLLFAFSAIALFSGEVLYWAGVIGLCLVWGISKSVQIIWRKLEHILNTKH